MIKTIAFLLAATVAHARIGETPDQCAARYGEITERSGTAAAPTAVHEKGGVRTTTYFRDGKCVALNFALATTSRARMPGLDERPVFTIAQSQAILDANGGGSAWEGDGIVGSSLLQATKDGTRIAMISPGFIFIELASEVARRKESVTPEAISKAIEGF